MNAYMLLKRVVVCLCVIAGFFALILLRQNAKPSDPYLENLRTRHVDIDPSEEDKARFTPLQYNVDRVIFEEALDVFLNPNLTLKEQEEIAPIIVNRIRFVQIVSKWDPVSIKSRERLVDKIEQAIDIGVYSMTKQSLRDDGVDLLRKRYAYDNITDE